MHTISSWTFEPNIWWTQIGFDVCNATLPGLFFWRQVAAVSNHGDYVSRRLMTFQSGEPHTKDKSYVHMVSGQIVGVMRSSSQVNALNTTGYHWISENGARASSYVGSCIISEFPTVNTHTLSFNFLFSKCFCIIRDILGRLTVVNVETVNPLPFFSRDNHLTTDINKIDSWQRKFPRELLECGCCQ